MTTTARMGWKCKANLEKFERIIKIEEQRYKLQLKQRKIARTVKDKQDWNNIVNYINEH